MVTYIEMVEKTLLIIHPLLLQEWNTPEANELITRIYEAEDQYSNIIDINQVVFLQNDKFWADLIDKIGGLQIKTDLAGIKRTICVKEVKKQLNKRGVHATIIEELTMD